MKWFRKHKFSTFVILLAILFIGWITWDNNRIQTTTYKIEDNQIPDRLNGFSFAQVSDLHNKDWGDKLVDELIEARPDIIVVTGDLIDSRKTDLTVAIDFITEASTIAPTYYVTGNHEARVDEYEELYESINDLAVILDNRQTVLDLQSSEEVRLLGLQDPDFSTSDTDTNLSAMTEDFNGYTILLSHRPELFETYKAYNIDLVLTGHAHGGQFRLPFIGGLAAPDQGLLPAYDGGSYTEEETTMIVSRGLGNSLFPFRINNPPELVIINLLKDRFPE